MIAVTAAMVAASVPGIHAQRSAYRAERCMENLTCIENAKIKYALIHNLGPGAKVTIEDLLRDCPEILPAKPLCPGGEDDERGSYTVGDIGTTPTCSLAAEGHFITKIRKWPTPAAGDE